MPKEPPDFDCRSAWQVLRLRFRDWMWPAAIAVAVAIRIAGHTGGEPYKIGSITDYANSFGALMLWLAAIFFAGFRWCMVGALRSRDRNRCARCGYPTTGLDDRDPSSLCPECGADATARAVPTMRSTLREAFRGVPISRYLIDLPGILVMLYPVLGIVAMLLMIFGVIDD